MTDRNPQTAAQRAAQAHADAVIMRRDISDLKDEMIELRSDLVKTNETLKKLVVAWEGANGVLTFMKWCAGVATTLAALWAVFGDKVSK